MNDDQPGAVRASWNPLPWFLVSFYSLAILWGVRSAIYLEPSSTTLLLQLAIYLCLGLWAVADARQRQRPFPRSAQFWVLTLAFVAVPGYVVATRGWKGLLWVVLHALAWFTITTLAMHVTGALYFGDLWWQHFGLN
jgi:hypothetical protein